MKWYNASVLHGNKLGKTIGYPTLNLDETILPKNKKQGVYACLVTYKSKIYTGALYLGPRSVLGETKRVLEIHLLHFSEDIYNETVSFCLKHFIRGLISLSSLPELQKQLKIDIQQVKEALKD
ncbi:MAG TPA: riboflavin kinase [Patescibacteria group bacterium]|nr:riboflavin kinase [Patescibacteria group bacterium]